MKSTQTPTTEELYAEHWQYVLDLLPGYGISASDQEDVAQTIWTSIHARIGDYDLHKQPSARAWITGFVRRSAANHRRAVRRRAEVLAEAPGESMAAHGLSPEQAAILRTLEQAIPDEARREAFVLQVRHGLKIAEIAAATGVPETTVQWRLQMAKRDLERANDEEGSKTGAYLGLGSLEALADALRPEPIPFEHSARLWDRIAKDIEAGKLPTHANGSRSSPATDGVPPVIPTAPGPTAIIMLTKKALAAVVAAVFAFGAVSGAGALLIWQALHPSRQAREANAREAGAALLPMAARSEAISPPAAPPSASDGSAMPARSSSPVATGASDGASDSERAILRMRRAAEAGSFDVVLFLADEHARQFRNQHVQEREAQRIRALAHLGRDAEAEQIAKHVVAEHPQLRTAMERALGRALP